MGSQSIDSRNHRSDRLGTGPSHSRRVIGRKRCAQVMGKSVVSENRLDESSHAAGGFGSIDDPTGSLAHGERSGVGVIEDPLGPLRNVARRWRAIGALIVAGLVLGWLSAIIAEEADTAPVAVDHYQAEHVLVLDSNVPDTQAVLGVRNLNVLAKRITIGEVPVRVSESVGLTQTEAATQIRVLIRSDSESLDLVGVGTTPAAAEALADAFAAELLVYLEAEATHYTEESIASAELRLAEAETNLSDVRARLRAAEADGNSRDIAQLEQDEQQFQSARIYANAALLDARADGVPGVPSESLQTAAGTSSVITESRFTELVDNASIGQNIEVLFGDDTETESGTNALSAVSRRLPTGMIPRVSAGAFFGLLVGVMVALVLNRLDNRVRSKRQVEALLDLPVIAEVPSLSRPQRRAAEVHARENPRSRYAEQYRALASTLSYARRARRATGQVVLVTSPGPSEGKTTTVANLGAMLAEAGESVLLVNCDFRRPRLHVLTGAEYQPMDLNPTKIPDVELISNVVESADALPTEVIAAQRSVIKKATQLYDLIIIDTAPLLATNDAVDLLDLVDDVVLVMRAGKTTTHAADRAVEILDRRRSHVLGVAITDVDSRHSADYYYGGYYREREQPFPRFSRWRRRAHIDLGEVAGVDQKAAEASRHGVRNSVST